MLDNKTLDKLITGIARSDTKAMEEFYSLTKTSVYGYALSIVKHPSLAEDIMQETYIRVFNYSKNYSSERKPMAWLLTIAKNLALTSVSHRSNKHLALEDEWISVDRDFTEASLDKMVLDEMLKSLSLEERQIITMSSLIGLKHREISEILELPLSTTLSKYYRALSKKTCEGGGI